MEKLDERNIALLKLTTEKLLKIMADNKELAHVREASTLFHVGDNELVQVQVLVTRDEFDLLEDFETVEMTNLDIRGMDFKSTNTQKS